MLKLPENTHQLRDAIKTAIEFYQGSPAKNDNKLNEALAHSLGFDNYDQLAPLIAEQEGVQTYPIEFDYNGEQTFIINGVRIDTELAHNEIVAYTVTDREDRIADLRQYIADAQRDPLRSHDVNLMQADLDTLLSSNAEWVLEAVSTNGFIAPDQEPKLFNETCEEMLAQAAEYYQRKVGELTKTGTIINNALTYYGDDPVGLAPIYSDELVLIKETYLTDDKLPIGMTIEKFEDKVPEGYIAACIGTFGEYVPIEFDED